MLSRLEYNQNAVITHPVSFQIFRAPMGNDKWIQKQWYALKHDKITTRCTHFEGTSINENTYQIRADLITENAVSVFKLRTVWTIFGNGEINVENIIVPENYTGPIAKMGFRFPFSPSYQTVSYRGLGPWDNYVDRKKSTFLSDFNNLPLNAMYTPYTEPQSSGNRMEISSLKLFSNESIAVEILPSHDQNVFNMSVSPWTEQEIACSKFRDRLPSSTHTYVNVDAFQMALGGASCGPPPLARYITHARPLHLGFVIRPLPQKNNQPVIPVAHAPLIIRDERGKVTIQPTTHDLFDFYVNGELQKDTTPFNFIEGNIEVRPYNVNKDLLFTPPYRVDFEKRLPKTNWKIQAVSSEEYGEGNASHLIDNDPLTYWHTAYTNFLPKYPHFFELDMNTSITFKGFVATARSNDTNGIVKKYNFYVSDDGKAWTLFASGDLIGMGSEKVIFEKSVRARYIKFEAVAPFHKTHPWASLAEFSILPSEK